MTRIREKGEGGVIWELEKGGMAIYEVKFELEKMEVGGGVVKEKFGWEVEEKIITCCVSL